MTRALLAIASAAGFVQAPPAQQPVFRAGVDLVRVDVQVVASNGEPIVDLTAADFQVAIDGRARGVVSAELVRFASPEIPATAAATPVRTPGYVAPDARVFVLAVDQLGFTTAGIGPLRPALGRFLDQLRPQDVVGVYPFPFRAGGIALTHDHRAIMPAVEGLVGLRETRLGSFYMTPSEIVEITDNNPDALQRVVSRECDSGDPSCPQAVRGEANSIGSYLEAEAAQRIGALRDLAAALAAIPGRKTVLLLSGSMISGPATRGRPDVSMLLQRLGEEISAAEINLYTVHWDTSFADAFSAAQPSSRRPQDRLLSLGADRMALAGGLELLTGKAGGALLRVEAGSGDSAFTRVLREASAYYVLGVETAAEDRDGKPHSLRLGVTRRGATIRVRSHVLIPRGGW